MTTRTRASSQPRSSVAGYDVVTETDAKRAIDLAIGEPFDAVVNRSAPRCAGRAGGLRADPRRTSRPAVIVMTGHASMDAAVAALRAGAYDFVTKPISAEVLVAAVARASQSSRLHDEVRRLQAAVDRRRASARCSARARRCVASTTPSRASHRPTRPRCHGRERHRQGADRACAPRPQQSVGGAVRRHQLARPCRRRYWRASSSGTSVAPSPTPVVAPRPLSSTRTRHAVPRRESARYAARDAGEAAPRAAGAHRPPVGGGTEVPFDARIIARRTATSKRR